jgi:membrane protease YdiL (CAAX protease family)
MIKLLAALVPYAAVLIGMYMLNNAWLTILLYHLGIIAFIFYRKPACLWKMLRSGFGQPWTISAIFCCGMTAPVVYFMWPWFAVSQTILPEWMQVYGLTGLSWVLLLPYFSIIHPVLEEIHWRGIAPQRFTWLCWQDLFFAGYHVLVLLQLIHWPWLFLVFGMLTGSSVFWRWAAQRYGGYGLTILTHAIADAGVIMAVCFLV